MSAQHRDSTYDSAQPPPEGASAEQRPQAGAVLLFDGRHPACVVVPLGEEPLLIGRGCAALGAQEDAAMSRQHARLSYQAGAFRVTDLGSRNGSAVDGERLHGELTVRAPRVLRLGHSLFLLTSDIRPFRTPGVRVDGQRVEGPLLQQLLRQVQTVAELSRTLMVVGESGAGKETVATAFHRASECKSGPFIAVNCATIPEGVAERLLFGAQKGAYSGAATDSIGYILAAHGGTLFLDEIGELDSGVQAKLLRVLETGEVAVLGTTRPRKVDIRLCSATHRDLRSLIAEGRFRADLYFRLCAPQVELPPLRQRLEEIPWHVCLATAALAPQLSVHASLIEACLLRAWPGNIRELHGAVRSAVIAARTAGSTTLGVQHLSPQAGTAFAGRPAATAPDGEIREPPRVPAAEPGPPAEPEEQEEPATLPTRAQVLAAVLSADNNISAAARTLGLHRTQLHRLLTRYRIEMSTLRKLT